MEGARIMSTLQEIRNSVINYQSLSEVDKKYSYMIVKPNGEKHFAEIIFAIRRANFDIEEMYKISDYEHVNMLLHPEEEKHKYIIPINRVYKDFYSNYGIIILISKANISYQNFVTEIVNLKIEIRNKYDYDYIASILDISKIGMPYNGETVKIISKSYLEVAKQKMNGKGSYLIISINELHSPDSNIENTIQELILLMDNGIIAKKNEIPERLIAYIKKYGTFSFLQNLD